MDWNLLSYVPMILCVLFILVLIWGVGKMWKSNNKFLAFIFIGLAVAMCILFYALYGKKIFG